MTDDKAGQVHSELSAGGTRRDVENTPTPELYPGPTIKSKSISLTTDHARDWKLLSDNNNNSFNNILVAHLSKADRCVTQKVIHLFWLENRMLNTKLEPSHYV